ncbi:MAG: S9 family peptidase [Candidatus Eisenbacteria bacterium]|nr:S9 family peptidase [Candidatus Eisenbacteria bacterium]
MREEDLLRLNWVADPQISPDGTRIAFTQVSVDAEEDQYRTHLWLADVPATGAAPAPARQLTYSGRDSQPRWSPDGATLAFVRKPNADDPAQIHLLPVAGGEARALTTLKGGASSPCWSPDGTRIAFLSGHNPALDTPEFKKPKNEPCRVVTRPEFRWNGEGFTDWDHLDHVWVVSAAGGEPRALTTGRRFKEGDLSWSADGARVQFSSDRREEPWFADPAEDNSIYSVAADLGSPTEGAALTVLADIEGPIGAFTPGPGGRALAVGGVRPKPMRSYDQNDLLLFEGPAPMTAPRVLTRGRDLAVGETTSGDQHPPRGGGALPLGFTADGGAVFGYVWQGATRAARVDLKSLELRDLTPADRDVYAGTLSADGSYLALAMGSLASPGDLWVCDVAGSALVCLHAPNAALLEESALGEVEEIGYESFDGRRIQGWIVKPPGFDPSRKYPLVLQIHGGPHVPYGFAFFHEFRVLAAAGYVVLYTNPRGSTSYGQEFGNCIQYRYPGDDYHDLMAGVEFVVAKGWVDEKRMGVTGGSGGGLLTNWIITRDDRFAAAITQRCVSDWAAMYYSCDFALYNEAWFQGTPWKDRANYDSKSPIWDVDKVNTPLMVLHSEEDWRTPIAQGEMMFRALQQQKKPAVMVRFPGESHELSRSGAPSRRVQNQQHIRRWFDHWLQGKPAPEYGF